MVDLQGMQQGKMTHQNDLGAQVGQDPIQVAGLNHSRILTKSVVQLHACHSDRKKRATSASQDEQSRQTQLSLFIQPFTSFIDFSSDDRHHTL